MPYKIVLADDHALLRQGLKRIIQENPDMKVIGEAGDGLELIKLLKTVTQDMAIVDVSMPNMRGIEVIREIKNMHPKSKVLILTMHKEKEFLYQAVSLGADGYLLKEDADRDLFNAIETIRQNKTYISPVLEQESRDVWANTCRGQSDNLPFSEPLTTRERQILKLIAEGKSSKEIGDLLFISYRTVDRHRANIMTKLNIKRTADLVKYAFENKYVD